MLRRGLVRIAVTLFFLHGGIIYAAESTGLRKIRSAITSISGSMSPSWAAHESGIFAKHGLQVEVVAMPSGLQGITTLAAREVDFVHIAGGTTAGAAIGGLDVKIIATLVGTLVLNLVVRPKSAGTTAQQTIGISRYGTSLHTGARIALRHFGLADGKRHHSGSAPTSESAPWRSHQAACSAVADFPRHQARQSPNAASALNIPTPPTAFPPAARSCATIPIWCVATSQRSSRRAR
jgi:ABC-type nitrate/sulfonate/bicarbonate transport system substrate-binding protein